MKSRTRCSAHPVRDRRVRPAAGPVGNRARRPPGPAARPDRHADRRVRGRALCPVRRHLRGNDVDRCISCAVPDHGAGRPRSREPDRAGRTAALRGRSRRAPHLPGAESALLARLRTCRRRMEHGVLRHGPDPTHPRPIGAGGLHRGRVPRLQRAHRPRDRRRLRPRTRRSGSRLGARLAVPAIRHRRLRLLAAGAGPGHVRPRHQRVRSRPADHDRVRRPAARTGRRPLRRQAAHRQLRGGCFPDSRRQGDRAGPVPVLRRRGLTAHTRFPRGPFHLEPDDARLLGSRAPRPFPAGPPLGRDWHFSPAELPPADVQVRQDRPGCRRQRDRGGHARTARPTTPYVELGEARFVTGELLGSYDAVRSIAQLGYRDHPAYFNAFREALAAYSRAGYILAEDAAAMRARAGVCPPRTFTEAYRDRYDNFVSIQSCSG